VSGQRHGSPETAAEPQLEGDPVSRRGFLGGGSAAVAAAVMVGHPATRTGAPDSRTGPVISSLQRRMIVQVAGAGAVFPLRLPVHSQAGPARAQRALSRLRAAQAQLGPGLLQLGAACRPTRARIRAAEQSMPPAELAAARAGADLLVRAGLLDSGHAPLLTGLGYLAATAPASDRSALVGAATLAVRTVFGDAAHHRARNAAGQWLTLLSAMHERGTLRPAIQQRGLA
jgi:hypothetical protein